MAAGVSPPALPDGPAQFCTCAAGSSGGPSSCTDTATASGRTDWFDCRQLTTFVTGPLSLSPAHFPCHRHARETSSSGAATTVPHLSPGTCLPAVARRVHRPSLSWKSQPSMAGTGRAIHAQRKASTDKAGIGGGWIDGKPRAKPVQSVVTPPCEGGTRGDYVSTLSLLARRRQLIRRTTRRL